MRTLTPCLATGSLCLLVALACGDTVENPESDAAGNAGGSASTTSESTADATTDATMGPTTGTGGTGPSACPPLEPAAATSCVSPGMTCAYDNCVAPLYRARHTLSCLQGAWVLTSEELCEQEASDCPEFGFFLGQTCDASLTPGPCSGTDACSSAIWAICEGGVWTRSANGQRGLPPDGGAGAGMGGAAAGAIAATGGAPIPVSCPVTPPQPGTPCCPSSVPAICDYSIPTAGLIPVDGSATSTTGQGGAAGSPGEGPVTPCLSCSARMVWETCGAG